MDPEFYAHSNVLCPNAPLFLSLGKPYQDFMVAQQQAGRELWFYSCSGPSKLLDPASYYRGQFWLNLKYGGKGSCYWAFGDEAGNSWNAYMQPRACFSPLFLSKTAVTDAKQMEAIREGAEDYEYFLMLRARVAELERKGVSSKLVAEAKTLLTAGPGAGGGDHGRGQDAVDGPQGPHRHGPRPAAGPRPVGEAEQAVETGASEAEQPCSAIFATDNGHG